MKHDALVSRLHAFYKDKAMVAFARVAFIPGKRSPLLAATLGRDVSISSIQAQVI